jgi:enterochelin esterase family protein
MTLWLPVGKETASGDGATTESKGRFFVTSELGVQIFDPAGRLAGIIAKPTPQSKVVSVEFAGKDHSTLFVAAGEKIFARQLKVTGYFR